MVAPIRYLSRREISKELGVTGYSEDRKTLEVVGKVGIGTTIFDVDPGAKLQVNGAIFMAGDASQGGDGRTGIEIGAGSPLLGVGTAHHRIRSAGGSGQNLMFEAQTADVFVPGGDIVFKTGGTGDRLRILKDGNIGIGVRTPTAKLTINPLTTLSTSGDIGGVSIANTENKTYPTTTSFNVTLGLNQDIEVGGTQVIDPSTPGGNNFISGIRNFLVKNNNNTQDIERSNYYGFNQNFDWDDANTCKQYVGIQDGFQYSGIDTNGRTSSFFIVGGLTLSPPDGGTQTITNTESKTLFVNSTLNGGISTVNITNASGYITKAFFTNFTSGTHSRNITNYSAYDTSLQTGAGPGTLNATITNYYGLRLNAPINSTGLTVTNNYGVYSGWSESKNYFAGDVGIGSTQPTAKLDVAGITKTEQLYVTGHTETDTLNVSGVSTFQGNINLGDDDRLFFGDGQDLEILHDGINSIINHRAEATGSLFIISKNKLTLQTQDSGGAIKDALIARVDGATELYYNDSKKLETTGIGVSISNGNSDTATISAPANLIIDPAVVGDNTGLVRIKGDLFVDGTQTQINSTTIELADFVVGIATTATTDLLSDGAGIEIGPDNTFKYHFNGGTNPSLKSSENLNVASGKGYQINQTEVLNSTTLGSGVTNSSLTSVGTLSNLNVTGVSTFQGDVRINDDDKLRFGTSGGGILQIYTNGTNSFFKQTSGDLKYELANQFVVQKDSGDEPIAVFTADGSVELYYDNAKKFETTGAGVTVTGTVFADGVDLGNGDRLRLGGGQDLQIYHGGSNGIIENTTGSLFIRDNGNNVFIQGRSGENSGIFRADGSVELYHDNSKKFETTGAGVTVFGTLKSQQLNVTGVSTFQDDVSIADKIVHTGDTDTAIRFPAADTFTVETNGVERFRISSTGAIGIGTNDPGQKLHIIGDGSPVILLEDGSGTDQTFARYKSSSGNWSAGADHRDDAFIINKSTNLRSGTPELYVHSNIGVGIGTTNPKSEVKSNNNRIFHAGIVTSRFYYGDGSNLTGIDASQVGALANIVEDTTPQLGGNLDLNSNDITGTGNIDITGSLNVSGVATFQSSVNLGELDRINFYTTNTTIYGDSNGLNLQASGSNDINIKSNSSGGNAGDIKLRTVQGGRIDLTGTGGVEIYHTDTELKFETTGIGVTVFGNTETQQLSVSGVGTFGNFTINGGSSVTSLTSKDTNGRITLQVNNQGGGNSAELIQLRGTGNLISANFRPDSGVQLYGRTGSNSAEVKLETTASGIDVTGHTETDTLNVSGNVGIATTNPTSTLHISGVGSTVNVGISTVELMVPNGAPKVRVGTHHWDEIFSTFHAKDVTSEFWIEQNSDNNDGPDMVFYKSRGVPGTELPVQIGDNLARIGVRGLSTSTTASGVGITLTDYPANASGLEWYVDHISDSGVPNASFNVLGRGSRRLTVTSDGKVGIGTTLPQTSLHIHQNVPIIRLTDKNQSTDNRSWNITAGQPQLLRIQAINDSGTGGGSLFDFYRVNSNVTEFRGTKSGNTWFVVNNTNERVGIGTDNPGAKLEVSGTGSSTIRVKDLDGANQFGQIFANNGAFIIESRNGTSDGQIIFRGRGASDTNEYARFDENGNLGIGTNNPNNNSKLHIYDGSAGCDLTITSGNVNAVDINLGDIDDHDIGRIRYNNSLNAMLFNTNGNERLRITSDGNIGIGTDDPSDTVDTNNTAILNVGIVTANFYYGDGSNLTGITASEVGALADVVDDTTPQLGGDLDLNSNDITGTGNIDINGSLNVSGLSTFTDTVSFGTSAYFGDGKKAIFGDNHDLQIYHDGSSYITHNNSFNLGIYNFADNYDVIIGAKNPNGTVSTYFRADGSSGAAKLYHIGVEKLSTKVNGIDVTGHIETDTLNVSGVATATSFSGNLTGTATTATALETARNFSVTGDFVTAPAVSFDGTGAVALAATITADSITLGTYTSGDYVESVSGTANEIEVTSGTGEGSTPTIGFVANPTIGGDVTVGEDLTVTRDLQVTRNLNVDGNVTIGGTSATIFAETLKITDPDLILGVRTDANGNDISTDNTANHGGVALASTEGTPLVTLVNPGAGETLPSTYKKIMWFKTGSFTGLNTDAWISNYAFGVGTTSMSAGTKFAVGNIEADFDDITAVRHINSTGVITATQFVGGGTGITGLTASQVGALAGVTIQDNSSPVGTAGSVGNINFVSSNLTATASGVGATITLTDTPTFTTVTGNLTGTATTATNADLINIQPQTQDDNVYYIPFEAGVGYTSLYVDTALSYNPGQDLLTFTNVQGSNISLYDTLNVSGISTFQSHVHLGDDDELRFGASNDFKIVHDPNDCRFENSNGDIKFKNTGSYFFFDEDGGETLASFINDGAVNLFHSGNKKFETTTDGIAVSGIVTASSGIVTYYGDGSNLTGLTASQVGSLAGVTIQEEGSTVGTAGSVGNINFVSDNLTATASGVGATITLTETPEFDNLTITGVSTFQDNIVIDDGSNSTNQKLALNNSIQSDNLVTILQNGDSNFGDDATVTSIDAVLNYQGTTSFTNNRTHTGLNLDFVHTNSSGHSSANGQRLITRGVIIDLDHTEGVYSTQSLIVQNDVLKRHTDGSNAQIGINNDVTFNNSSGDASGATGTHVIRGIDNDISFTGVNDRNVTIYGLDTKINIAGAGINTFTNIYGSYINLSTPSSGTSNNLGDSYAYYAIYDYDAAGSYDEAYLYYGNYNNNSRTTLTGERRGIWIAGATHNQLSGRLSVGSVDASEYEPTANQLVVYNDDSSPDAGITIVGGATTAFSKIHFADGAQGSAEDVGRIIYDHNTNELQLWTNNSQTMTIDNDGVGIGITNPTKKLEIAANNNQGGENNTLRFVDTDATSISDQQTGRIEFFTSDNDQSGVHAYILGATNNTVGNGDLRFGTGTAGSAEERLRITSGGDVGIGTDSPLGKLHLSDTNHPLIIDVNNSSSDHGIVFTTAGSSAYKAAIRLTPGGVDKGLRFMTGGYINSAERLRITSDGNVGINTTLPTEKLDVIGTVKATDFNTTSDQNLKTNIHTIENPIEKVVEIRGVNFEWKENNKPSAGVIAQEVEEVLPELINGEQTKTVNYNGLIGLLIEVVKEQQTQIDSLNERLSRLE